jgi:hypothetical protein
MLEEVIKIREQYRSKHPHNRTLVLYNEGLHVRLWEDPWYKKLSQARARFFLPFVKSLKEIGVTLLYRETSAQHFRFNRSGTYWKPWVVPKPDGSVAQCCAETIQPLKIALPDELMQRYLAELDPLWFQYIGWARFYAESVHMADAHVEWIQMFNTIDCSHYIYTPGAGTGHTIAAGIVSALDRFGTDPTGQQ